MPELARCASCGGEFKSVNARRDLPMCRACSFDRVADAIADGPTEIETGIRTYDPNTSMGFRAPIVKVIVRFEGEDAIRVILGDDLHGPDIYIERRALGWNLSLHPDAHDPIGTIEISDIGEYRFVPEAVMCKNEGESARGTLLSA